jgi:Zn-dependent metalloprotease
MSAYVVLPDDDDPRNDHGGVHINSGIPNHAFYLVATTLGGNAWESAGQIWYDTLTGGGLPSTADFATAAQATIDAATNRFGDGSAEQQAVRSAWQEVQVL